MVVESALSLKNWALSLDTRQITSRARLRADVTDFRQDATEKRARGGVCSLDAYPGVTGLRHSHVTLTMFPRDLVSGYRFQPDSFVCCVVWSIYGFQLSNTSSPVRARGKRRNHPHDNECWQVPLLHSSIPPTQQYIGKPYVSGNQSFQRSHDDRTDNYSQ